MTGRQNKPKALVFIYPYEGRMAYWLAGLSNFYQVDLYYPTDQRFRYSWQMLYRWLYSEDMRFFKYEDKPEEMLKAPAGYDAVFFEYTMAKPHFQGPGYHDKMLAFLRQLAVKGKKFYWSEVGEHSFYIFGRPEFWDMVTGVIKGQVFKPEFDGYLKDPLRIAKFQDPILSEDKELVEENKKFDIAKYRYKIFPFPFTPSVVDAGLLRSFRGLPRVYDFAANTRTTGNGLLRSQVISALQKAIQPAHTYSIEYDGRGYESNLPASGQPLDLYVRLGKLGKQLFKARYRKYLYPQPLYFHNLRHAKCYAGLGWSFSSLRTADCWGAGTVLVNFSFDKCDYGIPVKDGYNYVSIGERDEMTSAGINSDFKKEFAEQTARPVLDILDSPQRQKEIIHNQIGTYEEYFSSPRQFVKKIFIDKL